MIYKPKWERHGKTDGKSKVFFIDGRRFPCMRLFPTLLLYIKNKWYNIISLVLNKNSNGKTNRMLFLFFLKQNSYPLNIEHPWVITHNWRIFSTKFSMFSYDVSQWAIICYINIQIGMSFVCTRYVYLHNNEAIFNFFYSVIVCVSFMVWFIFLK